MIDLPNVCVYLQLVVDEVLINSITALPSGASWRGVGVPLERVIGRLGRPGMSSNVVGGRGLLGSRPRRGRTVRCRERSAISLKASVMSIIC
jgi:hypothetical protein